MSVWQHPIFPPVDFGYIRRTSSAATSTSQRSLLSSIFFHICVGFSILGVLPPGNADLPMYFSIKFCSWRCFFWFGVVSVAMLAAVWAMAGWNWLILMRSGLSYWDLVSGWWLWVRSECGRVDFEVLVALCCVGSGAWWFWSFWCARGSILITLFQLQGKISFFFLFLCTFWVGDLIHQFCVVGDFVNKRLVCWLIASYFVGFCDFYDGLFFGFACRRCWVIWSDPWCWPLTCSMTIRSSILSWELIFFCYIMC